MAVKPNDHLSSIPTSIHGSLSLDELSRLGVTTEGVLDFSVNTNPFGPPPSVLEVMSNMDISIYPDPKAGTLRHLLARKHDVSIENVWVGNGSSELILLSSLAYLFRGDVSYVVGPTYGEYERASQIVGAEVRSYTARAEGGFVVDMERLVEDIKAIKPRVIFICNPNNPTAQYIDVGQLLSLAAQFRDALFIIDEAYISFTANGDSCISRDLKDNLLVLRSMTKDYALTGLRLGYGVARPEVIDSLCKVATPWSVNSIAQAAGIAALEDTEHLESSIKGIAEAREYLCNALSDSGLEVFPSSANFFLVRVGDASTLRRKLLSNGICVRDCSSFGLPQFIRIGVRTMAECQRFVEAMNQVLAEG